MNKGQMHAKLYDEYLRDQEDAKDLLEEELRYFDEDWYSGEDWYLLELHEDDTMDPETYGLGDTFYEDWDDSLDGEPRETRDDHYDRLWRECGY